MFYEMNSYLQQFTITVVVLLVGSLLVLYRASVVAWQAMHPLSNVIPLGEFIEFKLYFSLAGKLDTI